MSKKNYSDISLPYDGTKVSRFVPQSLENRVKILESKGLRPLTDVSKALATALENPLDMEKSFRGFVNAHYTPGETITFLVDDHTRSNIHTKIILPKVIERLSDLGVRHADMQILISTGTHRASTQAEIENHILGKNLYSIFKDQIVVHDCQNNNQKIGISKEGTPILIDERILDSSIVIPLTDSNYHYFAGIAGTVKEFVPGNAGDVTVRYNHTKMFDLESGFKENVRLGNTEGNPVHSEIKEIVKTVSKYVDIFCIDCILQNDKIVNIAAGDIFACHEEAKKNLPKVSETYVEELGDLVIVSAKAQGIDLYQAGKAFHAGWRAVKKNKHSWIIVLATCRDKWGKDPFYEAMKAVKDMDADSAMKHLLKTRCTKENFEIGDQKPIDFFRIKKSTGEESLKIVSEMDPKLLKDVFRIDPLKKPNETAKKALRNAIEKFMTTHEDPTIYLLRNPDILTLQKNHE